MHMPIKLIGYASTPPSKTNSPLRPHPLIPGDEWVSAKALHVLARSVGVRLLRVGVFSVRQLARWRVKVAGEVKGRKWKERRNHFCLNVKINLALDGLGMDLVPMVP